jgi:hypothetical protein
MTNGTYHSIVANNYAVNNIIHNASGRWCWNTEVGCGPQIMGLKILMAVVITVFLVAFILDRKSKKNGK